ncbi:MAG: efflux RND transporter periplasmic adaptor subunit [Paludibacteraceae bacterium]|nr:efflux RND transporter periplasmic adaptor subunit [Paludibacteraceae bacterium]
MMGIGFSSCSRHQTENHTKPIAVTAQEIIADTVVCTHSYVGTLEDAHTLHLTAQTGGQITSVKVRRGDKVHRGQILLELDSVQNVNTAQSARATLHQAEDAYARVMRVYKEGGVTDQQKVEAETRLSQAQSMASMAEKALSDCRLTAPMDGIVAECDVQTGQTILPGQPIITLLRQSGCEVVFEVPEGEVANIRVGDNGYMEVPALDMKNIPIVVTEKGLIGSRIAHTYEIHANVSQETAQTFLPGMVGKVYLVSSGMNGYFIPMACIEMLKEGPAIWIEKDGKAERILISIGTVVDKGVLVTNGLKQGDHVITDGFQKLYQGAEVDITIKN